ncbi:MAG: amino acid-binding protein [bacterium]
MPLETQISVFLKNKVGNLNALCTALSAAHINIRALSTVDDVDWAIVGLIVDDIEKAREVLKNLDHKFGESVVLAVPMDNKPGEIARITKLLSDNNISIVHTYLTAEGARSLLVLMTTDNKKASELLAS